MVRGLPNRLRAIRVAEPAVTLTDYLLTIEAACCGVALARDRGSAPIVRIAGAAFFGATGAAACAGGTVHGFFPDEEHPVHRALWSATLLAIGGGMTAAWALGAGVGYPPRVARALGVGAAIEGVRYARAILGGERRFAAAVAAYLPATLFLLGTFGWLAWRDRTAGARLALAGVALTLVAAGIQQGKLGLHPRYCDHNTLYHLVEGAALLLFFLGLRSLGPTAQAERPPGGGR